LSLIFLLSVVHFQLYPLDPPTREMVEKYKHNGSWEARVRQARSYGNHIMSPRLIRRFKKQLAGDGIIPDGSIMSPPAAWRGMPTTGTVNIPVLLIKFPDYPHSNSAAYIGSKIFGKGRSSEYPLESLTEFYQRSSFGKLKITGNILGWYTHSDLRENIEQGTAGRESLIMDALKYYDSRGHNFSQYDNDNDGYIDYLVVIWSGTHGEWASFWWAYQTGFYDRSLLLDGKRLSSYSWQWESRNYPKDEFSPSTLIHETGHALGLPDLYDYEEGVGPDGGVGGMDIMDAIWGDHNSFHKYMLNWISPVFHNDGSRDYSFSPAVETGESLIIMPDVPSGDVFGEFFMVENRSRTGNDVEIPEDGLIIWHIDSTLDRTGRNFEYDNSTTDHKYVRLMEADGLEEIEQDGYVNAGDFYTEGDRFTPGTMPGSLNYTGENTGIHIHSIFQNGNRIQFHAAIDIPVEITLTGERAQEKSWIVVADYADLSFTFTKKEGADLAAFIVYRQYGILEFEQFMTIDIGEVSGNTHSIKDSSIEKKPVYHYKVMAVDSQGNILGISGKVKI